MGRRGASGAKRSSLQLEREILEALADDWTEPWYLQRLLEDRDVAPEDVFYLVSAIVVTLVASGHAELGSIRDGVVVPRFDRASTDALLGELRTLGANTFTIGDIGFLNLTMSGRERLREVRRQTLHVCPVCNYDGLFDQPWVDDSPSDEICPCCGIQFGLDDVGNRPRDSSYARWREKWMAQGCPWFSRGRKPPGGWDPQEQLGRAKP